MTHDQVLEAMADAAGIDPARLTACLILAATGASRGVLRTALGLGPCAPLPWETFPRGTTWATDMVAKLYKENQ